MAGVKSSKRTIGKSVFDGLTANRRSCKDCGYTEAVMHFGFDNWQLALPRSVSTHHDAHVSSSYFHMVVGILHLGYAAGRLHPS